MDRTRQSVGRSSSSNLFGLIFCKPLNHSWKLIILLLLRSTRTMRMVRPSFESESANPRQMRAHSFTSLLEILPHRRTRSLHAQNPWHELKKLLLWYFCSFFYDHNLIRDALSYLLLSLLKAFLAWLIVSYEQEFIALLAYIDENPSHPTWHPVSFRTSEINIDYDHGD